MLDRALDTFDEIGAVPLGPPLLEARGLRLEIDGQSLIDGVDVALEARSVTVVLGHNGAGKSVLLRLLHGLVAPTCGEVLWNGARLSDAARAQQAMVFQRPVLLRRSAAANIDFVLRLRGGADPARRDALLAHVGLADKARCAARRLSGGEQQRLAVARALATDPRLLLLDEPTANLDPASTARIEELVRDAARRGVKIVFVTHDLAQARRIADDVVFLHAGRVAEHTGAARFFAGPTTRAARSYAAGRLLV